jgi:hypothetical protein
MPPNVPFVAKSLISFVPSVRRNWHLMPLCVLLVASTSRSCRRGEL